MRKFRVFIGGLALLLHCAIASAGAGLPEIIREIEAAPDFAEFRKYRSVTRSGERIVTSPLFVDVGLQSLYATELGEAASRPHPDLDVDYLFRVERGNDREVHFVWVNFFREDIQILLQFDLTRSDSEVHRNVIALLKTWKRAADFDPSKLPACGTFSSDGKGKAVDTVWVRSIRVAGHWLAFAPEDRKVAPFEANIIRYPGGSYLQLGHVPPAVRSRFIGQLNGLLRDSKANAWLNLEEQARYLHLAATLILHTIDRKVQGNASPFRAVALSFRDRSEELWLKIKKLRRKKSGIFSGLEGRDAGLAAVAAASLEIETFRAELSEAVAAMGGLVQGIDLLEPVALDTDSFVEAADSATQLVLPALKPGFADEALLALFEKTLPEGRLRLKIGEPGVVIRVGNSGNVGVNEIKAEIWIESEAFSARESIWFNYATPTGTTDMKESLPEWKFQFGQEVTRILKAWNDSGNCDQLLRGD